MIFEIVLAPIIALERRARAGSVLGSLAALTRSESSSAIEAMTPQTEAARYGQLALIQERPVDLLDTSAVRSRGRRSSGHLEGNANLPLCTPDATTPNDVASFDHH
jgi:hypothetical protein